MHGFARKIRRPAERPPKGSLMVAAQPPGAVRTMPWGAWTALLPTRSNRANRSFAGTTVAGHFARTGPVLVHLVRAEPVPVHFAPAGPLLGDSARAGSLPAHFVRAGPFGAFAWAGQVGHFPQPVLGHFAPPVLGHLVRAVQARPVPVHLPRPPKPGIASTRLQVLAD